MKRPSDQPSNRDVYEELTVHAGEFVALFMAAIMLLGLVFGSPTLPGAAKSIVADLVAPLSHASKRLERSMEARASEHQVRNIEETAISPAWHPTHANGHHYRHRGHHGQTCLLCSASLNVKYRLKNHD